MKNFLNIAGKNFNMLQNVKLNEGINDEESYSLQSPKELIESKLGIC